MKIKLSKSQWEMVGRRSGWMRTAQSDWNQLAEEYKSNMNNPETIVKILRIGEDNWLSKAAASNAKCPPEVLAEVLRQGRDNGVSRAAAQNPNCPPEAKQEWLRIINPNRQAGKTKRMKKEAGWMKTIAIKKEIT